MDYDAVAKRIRARIFDQADADGRVLHRDAMDKVIAEELRSAVPPAPSIDWTYGGLCMQPGNIGNLPARTDPTEWR